MVEKRDNLFPRTLLVPYAETGHLPIDNNAIENDIRPIAVGRKEGLVVHRLRTGGQAGRRHPDPDRHL